jgi:hypothetical protein
MRSGNKVRFPRSLIHVTGSTKKDVGTAELKLTLRIVPAVLVHLLQLHMHALKNVILYIA